MFKNVYRKFLLMALVALATMGIVGALSADASVTVKDTGLQSYPVEASTQIYKGALVCTNAAGYLAAGANTAGHRFVGVAYENVLGTTQGAKACRVMSSGVFKLTATSITQAMVGSTMYLVDDATIDDVPGTQAIAVGKLVEYVSATSGWVEITTGPIPVLDSQSLNFVTKTDNYTVLAADSGVRFAIATDAKVFTLPATVAGLVYEFWNTGADGNNIITISPNSSDLISGGGLTGVDDKDLINTKATAKKHDMVRLVGNGTTGWVVTEIIGIWAKES